MDACVISVIGVTLNRRRSDSRIAFAEVDRRQLKGFAEPVRTFEFRGAISDQEN
jgi:class 3 adenylate cyclase